MAEVSRMTRTRLLCVTAAAVPGNSSKSGTGMQLFWLCLNIHLLYFVPYLFDLSLCRFCFEAGFPQHLLRLDLFLELVVCPGKYTIGCTKRQKEFFNKGL